MFYEIVPILLISILPGYFLLSLDRRLNDIERLALSFAFTFVLVGGVGFVLHLMGVPLIYSLLSVVPVVGVMLWKRTELTFNVPRNLLIILVVALLIRFFVQFFFQYPMGGDSYFHMDLARTFTTDRWFEVNAIDTLFNGVSFPHPEEYRPPFFNFVMGFFFNMFGTSFDIAKLLNVVIGTVMIIPIYLIAKKYSNDKIVIIVSLFVALNPLLINQSIDAEVRIFTVYLALASLYFFIKGNKFWLYSGILLGLLYITHYAPATILLLTYAAYFALFNRKQIFTKRTAVLILSFLIVISPWLVRNYIVFGDPVYSSSKYVSLSLEYSRVLALEPPTVEEFFSNVVAHPYNFIFTKVTNLYRSFFPLPFQGSGNTFWVNFDPGKNVNVMLNPISMIITLPVFFFAMKYILSGIRNIRKEKDILILYIVIGFLIGFIFWNYRSPFNHNFLFQQLVLMAILGFVVIDKMKLKDRTRKIVYVAIAGLLLAQIPVYQLRVDVKSDFGQDWISGNTNIEDVVMVRWTNVNIINLYTNRKVVSIPFEDEDTVLDFAKKNNISYIIIDQLDLDTKKLSVESLSRKLELVGVYKVPEPRFSRDYTNTYWMFKI